MSSDGAPTLGANGKDIVAGLIFIGIGAFFAGDSWLHLPLGDVLRMGPGFYPFALGICLIGLGAAIAIGGILQRVAAQGGRRIPWRAILVLVPLPVFFGLAIRGLGLVPTVFIVSFAATFASTRTRPREALLLSVGMTVFCTLIFSVLAGLPTPVFGSWLGPANDWWYRLLQGQF